jgi:hypothetical protein
LVLDSDTNQSSKEARMSVEIWCGGPTPDPVRAAVRAEDAKQFQAAERLVKEVTPQLH